MSEITPVPAHAVPDGYAQRTIQVQGVPMTFTFYKGFASRVSYTPQGGAEIPVYQQEGVFKVPGGGGPAASSKMWISGGPDALDVELEIDDSPRPAPNYDGPIESFDVTTRRGGGGASNPRVRPIKGQHHVTAVQVQLKRADASVRPHMPADGGTTTVVNTAQCCPPTC
jgi:hypothetical protein